MKAATKTKFVKLTSYISKEPIYINIDMIGHIYEENNYTVIGHLTHRNGGFNVTQDLEEVLELINQLNK
jgi:hypothetical protein